MSGNCAGVNRAGMVDLNSSLPCLAEIRATSIVLELDPSIDTTVPAVYQCTILRIGKNREGASRCSRTTKWTLADDN
jgi:hypothetical protein